MNWQMVNLSFQLSHDSTLHQALLCSKSIKKHTRKERGEDGQQQQHRAHHSITRSSTLILLVFSPSFLHHR